MEQLLLSLINHISVNFPNFSCVAEDCGQLDTQEDTYPVTFPCLLIGNTDIDWQDTDEGSAVQQGTGTITTRLAIDVYQDVHYGSNQEYAIAERMHLANELHRSLQAIEFTECPDIWPLSRIKSRDYTLPAGIKVYETIYRFTVFE